MMSGTSYEVIIIYPLLTLPDLKSFCFRLCHLKVLPFFMFSELYHIFETCFTKTETSINRIYICDIFSKFSFRKVKNNICYCYLHWLWLQVTYLLNFPARKMQRLSLPFGDWLLRLMHIQLNLNHCARVKSQNSEVAVE